MALRAKTRELIQAGTLPNRKADTTLGGPGCGNTCPVCNKVVAATDVEMELEFRGAAGGPVNTYHLHGHCFAAWETELRNLETARKTGVFDGAMTGSLQDTARL